MVHLPARRTGALLACALSVLFATSAAADVKSSAWLDSAGRSSGDHRNPRLRLDLPQQATVVLDLESAVDTYLYLLNQAGSQQLAYDDDSGAGLNSRIQITLPAGRYTLVAATYSPAQKADFTARSSVGSLSLCFAAYEHANYGGTGHVFCEGGSPFLNDAYSSLRVPKGLRVRAFQHGNGTGLKRTYFTDTPWVGNLYNDMISAFSWSDFQVTDFYMITGADPQFSWDHCSDNSSSSLCQQEKAYFGSASDDAIGRTYNGNIVNAMNRVKSFLGDGRVGGVIVNGDLTEFGDQDVDLDNYIEIYEHSLDMNVYLGLGNHDYANNVDDCFENQCASSMVWYFKDQVSTLSPSAFDYAESGTYYQFPSFRRDHSGSLGYSWDVGNVHFVQLNNHPSYTRSWNGWNFSAARRDYFSIRSALSWLRADLQKATGSGKKIILNLHDWGTDRFHTELRAILNDFPVTAVYAGHWHSWIGQYEQVGPFADGRKAPVLLSGSAHYGTFLVNRFVNGKLYVWVMKVDHYNGARLTVLYNGASYDASNLSAIFNVCSGRTRYHQYEYDLR